MKKIIGAIAAVAALGILAGCATPTPYQAATSSASYHTGYTDTRIEDGRYRISFAGNDSTPRETVETYLLYHAADLTLSNGYDWFEVVHRATDEKTRTVNAFDDPFMGGMSWRFYGRGRWSAWSAWDMNDMDRDTFQYSRYEAIAEILMHKGTKPESQANAYDARSVKANLESKIVRPAVK